MYLRFNRARGLRHGEKRRSAFRYDVPSRLSAEGDGKVSVAGFDPNEIRRSVRYGNYNSYA